MVKARDVAARFAGEARWTRALPVASGAFLFLLGAWLTLQSLAGAGLVRLLP